MELLFFEIKEINMKNTLLKVISIIMIIGGVLNLIIGFINYSGVADLHDRLLEVGMSPTMYYVASILIVVTGVLQLLAGIVGISTAGKGKSGLPCIILGILIIVVVIVNYIISISIETDNVLSLVLGFVLPILYLIGAFMQKKYVGKAPIKGQQPAPYGQPAQPGPYGQPAPQAPAQPYAQPTQPIPQAPAQPYAQPTQPIPQAPAQPIPQAPAQPVADAAAVVEDNTPKE